MRTRTFLGAPIAVKPWRWFAKLLQTVDPSPLGLFEPLMLSAAGVFYFACKSFHDRAFYQMGGLVNASPIEFDAMNLPLRQSRPRVPSPATVWAKSMSPPSGALKGTLRMDLDDRQISTDSDETAVDAKVRLEPFLEAVLALDQEAIVVFRRLFRPDVTASVSRWRRNLRLHSDPIYSEGSSGDLHEDAFTSLITTVRLSGTSKIAPLRSWLNRPPHNRSPLRAFIRTCLTRDFLSLARKRRRSVRAAPKDSQRSEQIQFPHIAGKAVSELDRSVGDGAAHHVFLRCWAKLTSEEQHLIEAMLSGARQATVASVLGISAATVSRHTDKAQTKLYALLAAEWPELFIATADSKDVAK